LTAAAPPPAAAEPGAPVSCGAIPSIRGNAAGPRISARGGDWVGLGAIGSAAALGLCCRFFEERMVSIWFRGGCLGGFRLCGRYICGEIPGIFRISIFSPFLVLDFL